MNDKVKPFKMPQKVQAALELLLQHGRQDYGGARRCAMFLLSLWDRHIGKRPHVEIPKGRAFRLWIEII